jgi:hypothetical protein
MTAPRWDALFADLEAQAAALEVAERAGEIDERTRIEVAGLSVLDRIRPAVGQPLRIELIDGLVLAGRLRRVGSGWLLLDEGAGREAVVSLAAAALIGGLGRRADTAAAALSNRLTLRSVLRAIARDRSGVRVGLVGGAVVDATIDRVGADFVEIARHAPGEVRRREQVRDVQVVPFSAVATVRRSLG